MRALRLSSVACLLWASGCDKAETNLERLLAEMLPPGITTVVTEACAPILGPAVGLFTISAAQPSVALEDELGEHTRGHWTRAPSLSTFAGAEDATRLGPGVGATIVDAKTCLRTLTEEADAILFEPQPALYYRSDNYQVVAIVFEAPANRGVIFVQAP